MVGITPAAAPLQAVRPAPAPATSAARVQAAPTSTPATPEPVTVREAEPPRIEAEASAQAESAVVAAEAEHLAPSAVPPADAPAVADTPAPAAAAASWPAEVARSESATPSARQQVAFNDAFQRLDGGDYVLQLLSSPERSEVVSAAARYSVDRASLYVLEIRRDGQAWWLLLWAPFPDADSARNALTSLAEAPAASVWPRRIAPLQGEARRVTQ